MMTNSVEVAEDWSKIREKSCSILVEERRSPLTYQEAQALLSQAPFCRRSEGRVNIVLAELSDLPDGLKDDIARLSERFMELMRVNAVRVRLEGVTTNACKKVHSDYTDLRLITTYSGPGTNYAAHGDGNCCLEHIPTGAVALFKGKLFGAGHRPCLHRSPPIEGSGESRLVLVIDTPLREAF